MSNTYGSGLQYAVDIVFCIDVTGSMHPVIDEVKEGALTFHDKLLSRMAEKSKTISQLRLRVVAFRDFGDNPSDAIEASRFFVIPDQTAEYERFVKDLRATGGGDIPESGLEALWLAMESDWERGLDRRRHVVVMFTDAPAHPIESSAARRSANYPATMPTTMNELTESWGDSTSQTAMMENSSKRLLLFAPDDTPWNIVGADWNNTIQFQSQAGRGLEEYEMSEIIDCIANSI